MDIVKLSKYIRNNDLSLKQVISILTEFFRDIYSRAYRRGYWTRDADMKKIRKARDQRLRKEHETKELNQDK